MKNNICFIISNLDIGGAELSLSKIVVGLGQKFNFTIITFKKNGIVGKSLKEKGFNVISLNLEKNVNIFAKLFYLYKLIKEIKPDVVHTWMYHADFLGGLISKFAGVKTIYWNIRNTELLKGTSIFTRIIGYFNSIFSYLIPTKIVFVSESSKKYHSDLFYCKYKMTVIPNGYDTSKYSRDISKGKIIRNELKIPEDSIIIGSIARFNEYKDHKSFIIAALNLLDNNIDNINIQFVLLGKNVSLQNEIINKLLENSNHKNKFHLLGEKNNIIDYYSLFDIFCLHSISEGFPNVLAEAMSSGLPCVSTNVGDSKLLLKSNKYLVSPKSPLNLSKLLYSLCRLSNMERDKIGLHNQKLVHSNYSTDLLFEKYSKLYL